MRRITLLLLFIIVSPRLLAQITTTTIIGKITNNRNEAVAASTVKLINEKNNFQYQTQSNSKGFYRIPNIKPDNDYQLIVKGDTINNIQLIVGQTYTINFITDSTLTHNFIKKGVTADNLKRIPFQKRDDVLRIFPQLPDEKPVINETIDQLAVLERYDVRDNGLDLTSITKSGTNQFSTTAYTYLSDEFKSKTYGAALGGAIVRNKLFYYINADLQRDNNNKTYDFTNYKHASYNDIESIRTKTALYDVGSYTENKNHDNNTTIFARLDWNVSERTKITLINNNLSTHALKGDVSDHEMIRFNNSLSKATSKLNTTSLEILSNTSPASSNRFFFSVDIRKDDEGYRGDIYPSVFLQKERILLGSNPRNNSETQKQFTLEDNIEFNKGKHTITIGTHNELQFIKQKERFNAFGSYIFKSARDFTDNNKAIYFTQTYYEPVTTQLSRLQSSFYVQDIVRLKSNFTLTYGIRLEIPIQLNSPESNEQYNQEIAPLLNDAVTGSPINISPQLLPRISFDWIVKERLTLNGGVGLFSKQTAYQHLLNPYLNNGMSSMSIMCDTGIDFSTDLDNRPPTGDHASKIQPNRIDLTDERLKSPLLLKTRLEAHYTTISDIILSFTGSYSKLLKNTTNCDLLLYDTGETTTGSVGDNRPIYGRYDVPYSEIIYTTNTKKGHNYNLTFSLYKDFHSGFSVFAAYNYNNIGNSSIRSLVSYRLKSTNTTFSLFYEGGYRSAYSLTVNNQPMYIPIDANDINLIDRIDNELYTKEEQWNDLNAFINNSSYLKNHRGEIAKSGSEHTPWENLLDFRIMQTIRIAQKHDIELSLDIMNICKSKRYEMASHNYSVLDFMGYESDGTTPRYTVNPSNLKNKNSNNITSNMKFQLGIRYRF